MRNFLPRFINYTPLFSCLFGLILLFPVSVAVGQSGRVFRDFNNNGIKEGTEPGMAGIGVRAYRSSGAVSGSALTDGAGLYSLLPAANAGDSLRVEFDVPASFTNFFPGAAASGAVASGAAASGAASTTAAANRTSVQFVVGPATGIDYALNYPTDFCEAGPPVSVVCFIIGAGTTVGDNNLIATIPYSATGAATGSNTALVGHPNTPATGVGAIWGTSFHTETGSLYASAFMRRHTAFGTGGTGEIYVTVNPRNPATSASYQLINLNGLVVSSAGGGQVTINTGENPHLTSNYLADIIHTDGNGKTQNPADSVGKISFGDMDMSNDQRYLYVVGLNDNRLYRITIDADNDPATNPTAADVLAYAIPNPGCVGGKARPFGLGIRGDKVFVGVTCDASTSLLKADLRGYVYTLNTLDDSFTEAVNFPLDYARGNVSGGTFPRNRSSWQPWNSDVDWNNNNGDVGQVFSFSDRPEMLCPQPLLSDIVFDDDGSLVVGLMDRFGHQGIFHGPDPAGNLLNGQYRKIDPRAGGDVLRVCNIGTLQNPVYSIETLGKCGTAGGGQFTDATYPNDDPNSTADTDGEFEFYTGDNFNTDSHTETSMGSLGLVPGSGELIVTAFDPIRENNGGAVYTNGFKVLSNTTGKEVRGFSLLNGIPENNGNNEFGKASGLGGLEVLCLPKPLEIGNRAWLDQNKNGVQDAGELPIADVQLQLYNEIGALVGETTTGVNGEFYFNNANVVDTVGRSKPNRPGPQTSTRYEIRVSNAQFAGGVGAGILTNRILTRAKADASPGGPARDSDAALTGTGLASVSVLTGYTGENNHTYDIGFTAPPCATSLSISRSECNSVNNANTYSVTATVTVTNLDGPTALTVAIPGAASSFVRSFTVANFTYTVVANGLGSDGLNKIATATFSGTACGAASQTYTAPASCSVAPVCSLTAVPTAGLCQTATNTFSSTVVVGLTNTNAGGTLTITDGGISQTLTVGPGFRGFTATAVFGGLPSNGQSRTVTVSLPGCASVSQTYTAPAACSCVTPVFSLTATAVSCPGNGTIPNADGRLIVSGFTPGYTYRYSAGSAFDATMALPESATAIPAGGVLVSTLANPATVAGQPYTVRVYNRGSDCYTDKTITLPQAICICPAPVCLPMVIRRVVR